MKRVHRVENFDDICKYWEQYSESIIEQKEKWYITGDTHGSFSRFKNLPTEECNVIILGDSGVNYCLDERDEKFKANLKKRFPHITFYLVRGNHEERPEALPNIHLYYDEKVYGTVYIEDDFPHLRYLTDGGIYRINNHSVLTIGGAYSVDKYYRLSTGKRWFEKEQLFKEEMSFIEWIIEDEKFDLVLTHTCPYEWQPFDLFLSYVDQNTVDKTMEEWFSKIEKKMNYKKWLFGHFHADRKINDKAEMLFEKIVDLNDIMKK